MAPLPAACQAFSTQRPVTPRPYGQLTKAVAGFEVHVLHALQVRSDSTEALDIHDPDEWVFSVLAAVAPGAGGKDVPGDRARRLWPGEGNEVVVDNAPSGVSAVGASAIPGCDAGVPELQGPEEWSVAPATLLILDES